MRREIEIIFKIDDNIVISYFPKIGSPIWEIANKIK